LEETTIFLEIRITLRFGPAFGWYQTDLNLGSETYIEQWAMILPICLSNCTGGMSKEEHQTDDEV
jgi:hypothetical protein